MPVLAKDISVIVKNVSIVAKYRGGPEAFVGCCDRSYCDDGELTRVGFTSLQAATQFVCDLADRGLSPYNVTTQSAEDMIVAAEGRGFVIRCDWAEFGVIDWAGNPSIQLPACRARGSDLRELAVPKSWQPKPISVIANA